MRSGKIAFFIILLGVLLFILTIFKGEDLFFSSIQVEPEEIFNAKIPEAFEVEQSFKTHEGYIFSGIDRANGLRVQTVKQVKHPSQYGEAGSLLRDAKLYSTTKSLIAPELFVRYLAANIDPRRTEIKQTIDIPTDKTKVSLVLLIAQKHKSFGVIVFPEKNILFIASHPDEALNKQQVVRSAKGLGLLHSSQFSSPN